MVHNALRFLASSRTVIPWRLSVSNPPTTDEANPNSPVTKAEALYQRACKEILAGRGPFAMPLLLESRRLDPSHFRSVRLLTGLLMNNGLLEEGREIMEEYFGLFPYRTTRQDLIGQKPALLLVRGFSNSRVIPHIAQGGKRSTSFRGGAFTTRFLLLEPTYPIHHYTISAGNILRPIDLPEHTLILNTIADADIEGQTLDTLSAYLMARPDQPIINHPDQVLKLTRDQNSQRLNEIGGVSFPRTSRVRFDGADAAEMAAEIDRHGFGTRPVILKETGKHTSSSAPLFRTRKDVENYVGSDKVFGEFYLIQYIEELWKHQYFRKLRLFWIGSRFYPVVCHLDTIWNVHGSNRRDVMLNNQALMDEEIRFLEDWSCYVGTANVERLTKISELVDLDFFGIDFTIDSQGGLLIYELNPAMRHSFDHSNVFSYKLPYDEQISHAFADMVVDRLR